ncbi:uncharacterized protein J3R85_020305 [Psidium guajava]|nr:uncharacterized protein J3R85_020305 [Psidium guajava]
MDSDIALLPFDPMEMKMKMKVLPCSFISGIVLKKVQSLFHVLQPNFVVLPEDFKQHMILTDANSYSVLHDSLNETLKLPTLKKGSKVEITADLISRSHWKNLKEQNLSITRLNGKLVMSDARRQILSDNEMSSLKSESTLLWGALDS